MSKKVHFATHCDGKYIDYPSSEIDKRWYSSEEEVISQRRVWRDAASCSRVIMMGNPLGLMDGMSAKKFLVHCVGLEHLVSKTSVSAQNDSIKRARKEHASRVLEEYKKQKDLGAFCTVMLAGVSDVSSESARKRAHSRACINALLMD